MDVGDLLAVALLLFATWLCGLICEHKLGWPALVGEIVAGMLLGPGLADLVPHVEALSLVGQVGLLLLVLEGGLHIEIATLKRVGWKAFAIAISGTCLPVLCSWLILPALPDFRATDGLVAGTSLSSTAIGMAAKLMQDMNLLDSHLGQLICCAAMIDDVASLILLAVISNISGTESGGDGAVWGPSKGVWAFLIPLLASLVFLIVSWVLASAMPSGIRSLARFASKHDALHSLVHADGGGLKGDPSFTPSALLFLIFAFAVAMTAAAHYSRTTSLLGCFMAGVSFASVDGSLKAWDGAMPPLSAWTSRLFFGSIGFAVPVKELFSGKAVAYGALLTIIAVGSKVFTGVWEWDTKWTVGWAMVGRGELGFVMAEEGFTSGLTSKLTFAVTVWALLLATLISPIAFKQALKVCVPSCVCFSMDLMNLLTDIRQAPGEWAERRRLGEERAAGRHHPRGDRRDSPGSTADLLANFRGGNFKGGAYRRNF